MRLLLYLPVITSNMVLLVQIVEWMKAFFNTFPDGQWIQKYQATGYAFYGWAKASGSLHEPNSPLGTDGFGGKFYQGCWDIIKLDLLEVVKSFFGCCEMPKLISHASLLLVIKVKHPNKFNEFFPIILSNFTNKNISKLLCIRLSCILPHLISDNKLGFVEGRSISMNNMFAQEITQGIKKPNERDNVVIKCCMAKDYDRVSWSLHAWLWGKWGFVRWSLTSFGRLYLQWVLCYNE